MAGELIVVTGLKEVQAMLRDAPRSIVAGGFAKAGRAAAEVFEAEIWPHVPQDLREEVLENAAHGGLGPLVGRLSGVVELDSQFRGVHVEVGFGSLGHIALWLEYGHRQVKGPKPKNMTWREFRERRIGEIGFVPAHPFLRQAFDSSGDRAIEAFADSLSGTVKELYG